MKLRSDSYTPTPAHTMPGQMRKPPLLCYLVLKVMIMFSMRFLIEGYVGTH
jgi:hypothetical protein